MPQYIVAYICLNEWGIIMGTICLRFKAIRSHKLFTHFISAISSSSLCLSVFYGALVFCLDDIYNRAQCEQPINRNEYTHRTSHWMLFCELIRTICPGYFIMFNCNTLPMAKIDRLVPGSFCFIIIMGRCHYCSNLKIYVLVQHIK